MGVNALGSAQTADRNVAIGKDALAAFTGTGDTYNVAIGFNALGSSSTGAQNAAVGGGAMGSNTTGGSNTALGYFALTSNLSNSIRAFTKSRDLAPYPL